MKWAYVIVAGFACVAGTADASPARTFAAYEIILERKPFGAPPDRAPEPERVIPVHESFAAQMVLSGIYELDDGNLRVAVVDKKDNSYFALMVGEQGDGGIELLDADYEEGEAVLKKGEEVVVLRMSGSSGTQVLTTSERQDRIKQAEARRLSYAERRRQRMLARQKPVEVPKPIYTGEDLERHLQDYQMEVIRQGLPPLPVQLTPDRDAQLVAEGLLPPVDEEGYELEYYEDEYYEDY
ncbi:MAG: hypothetical protein GX548_12680 [Lentisphaerae bacterium]|nr:hypothetical protein [Lentisphaerota bacterium]